MEIRIDMNIPNHHFIFWGEILRDNKKKEFAINLFTSVLYPFQEGPGLGGGGGKNT